MREIQHYSLQNPAATVVKIHFLHLKSRNIRLICANMKLQSHIKVEYKQVKVMQRTESNKPVKL